MATGSHLYSNSVTICNRHMQSIFDPSPIGLGGAAGGGVGNWEKTGGWGRFEDKER